MSNPQQPHGLQPTRLLHPWDFPGKSTGVGSYCLLQKWRWEEAKYRNNIFIFNSHLQTGHQCLTTIILVVLGAVHFSSVAQLCPTLSMDCSLPGSSVHGIFQARVLEWGAIAFSECREVGNHFSPSKGKLSSDEVDTPRRSEPEELWRTGARAPLKL